MYSARLLDHFQTPRNVGELPEPSAVVQVENPVCGDVLRLSVNVLDGILTEIRYKTRGCAASIAAGSALTEWLKTKSKADLETFQPSLVEDLLDGLPNESKHAALLCADAVKALALRMK